MREFENQALKKKCAGLRTLLLPYLVVCGEEEPRTGKPGGQNLGSLRVRIQEGGRGRAATIRGVASWCTEKPLAP